MDLVIGKCSICEVEDKILNSKECKYYLHFADEAYFENNKSDLNKLRLAKQKWNLCVFCAFKIELSYTFKQQFQKTVNRQPVVKKTRSECFICDTKDFKLIKTDSDVNGFSKKIKVFMDSVLTPRPFKQCAVCMYCLFHFNTWYNTRNSIFELLQNTSVNMDSRDNKNDRKQTQKEKTPSENEENLAENNNQYKTSKKSPEAIKNKENITPPKPKVSTPHPKKNLVVMRNLQFHTKPRNSACDSNLKNFLNESLSHLIPVSKNKIVNVSTIKATDAKMLNNIPYILLDAHENNPHTPKNLQNKKLSSQTRQKVTPVNNDLSETDDTQRPKRSTRQKQTLNESLSQEKNEDLPKKESLRQKQKTSVNEDKDDDTPKRESLRQKQKTSADEDTPKREALRQKQKTSVAEDKDEDTPKRESLRQKQKTSADEDKDTPKRGSLRQKQKTLADEDDNEDTPKRESSRQKQKTSMNKDENEDSSQRESVREKQTKTKGDDSTKNKNDTPPEKETTSRKKQKTSDLEDSLSEESEETSRDVSSTPTTFRKSFFKIKTNAILNKSIARGPRKRTFSCSTCDKQYSTQRDLRLHALSHEKLKEVVVKLPRFELPEAVSSSKFLSQLSNKNLKPSPRLHSDPVKSLVQKYVGDTAAKIFDNSLSEEEIDKNLDAPAEITDKENENVEKDNQKEMEPEPMEVVDEQNEEASEEHDTLQKESDKNQSVDGDSSGKYGTPQEETLTDSENKDSPEDVEDIVDDTNEMDPIELETEEDKENNGTEDTGENESNEKESSLSESTEKENTPSESTDFFFSSQSELNDEESENADESESVATSNPQEQSETTQDVSDEEKEEETKSNEDHTVEIAAEKNKDTPNTSDETEDGEVMHALTVDENDQSVDTEKDNSCVTNKTNGSVKKVSSNGFTESSVEEPENIENILKFLDGESEKMEVNKSNKRKRSDEETGDNNVSTSSLSTPRKKKVRFACDEDVLDISHEDEVWETNFNMPLE